MKITLPIYKPLLRILCSAVIIPITASAQFTPGNITVLQLGDGSASLVNTGNAIVLKEYATTGALTYSMTVPVTGANALLMSGSSSSEGFLSLSADTKYLVFGGYAATLPNTTPLPGATASTINRGVGLVGGAGLSSYTRAATSTAFFTGSGIRGAAALNNTNLWASGGNQGANYFGTVTAPLTVQNTKTNLRAIAVFNGQLYCSSQVATGTPSDIGVYAIGTGANVISGQQVTTIINTGAGSEPAQFYFNSTGTVCYVADQRNSSSGGIQKWVQSAGSWSLAYTLATGATPAGATGVVADFSGTNAIVYATTTGSSANQLIAVNDVGAASTATTLATASTANTVFRGLAFSPCTAPIVSASAVSPNVCAGQTLALTATAMGSAPFTYNWSGPALASTTLSSAVITAQSSSIYTVTVTNLCGVETATLAVTVVQPPAVTSNSAITCAGNTATLTASGATSYSWSTGNSSAAITVTPASSTIYSVTGTDLMGCSKTVTTAVIIATTPFVTVNSATVCSAGDAAMLMASGANSFTWSTGSFADAISVLPSAATVYSVSGSLSGCAGISTQTAMVSVLPSPTLSISGASLNCGGSPVSQTVSGASTYTWDSGSASDVISVSPSVTTVYSVTGTAANGCISRATSTIALSSPPTISVTYSPTFLCNNGAAVQTITFTASGATAYGWKNNLPGGPVYVDTVALNPNLNSLNYTVTGSTDQNCFSTSLVQVGLYICEGIEDNVTETGWMVYPNPAKDRLMLVFPGSGKNMVRLINTLGQEVYSALTDNERAEINLEHFAKGIYTVIYFQNGKTGHKTLLIDR